MKLVRFFCSVMIVMSGIDGIARLVKEPDFECALINGADTQVRLYVRDECGKPISNASIKVTLANRTSDYSICGFTDTNGVYVVAGSTTGDYLQFSVTKSGYYDSWERMSYIELGREHQVKNGKWQPFADEHRIILRRIQNPSAIQIGHGKFALTKHLNCWLGFDLHKCDFVRPYGSGEVADFEVSIEWDGKWYPEYAGMGIKLRFTTPYAGYYERPVDPSSKFKGPYAADADKAFSQNASFDERVVSPTKRVRHPFDDNKCWVIRSRCAVDETGKLISANYSVIYKISFCGKPDGRGGLRIIGSFNPIPNDMNLEPKKH